MKLEELKKRVRGGEIDTIIVAFPDVYGRLMGKRVAAPFFLDHVARDGTHGCNYLLTVNMEMDPVPGFKLASWDKGYGDFHLVPDLSNLRLIPWQAATAMVLCDVKAEQGGYVAEAPRSVLRAQLEKLRQKGFDCRIASELEFFLFNTTYRDGALSGFTHLPPSSEYRIDYHLLQPTRDEPLMRAIRNGMNEAEIPVESSKGEWGKGQHELNFVYGEPLAVADRHMVFKQGAKEIADQFGKSITFMAKPSAADAGSSCHIHLSLWQKNKNVFNSTRDKNGSAIFQQFLGGLMKYMPELCYFAAPTVNAYKRYQAGSWAPTKMAWAFDNRTAGFRVVGAGPSFRVENRMPGADANPYLAFAAMIAAGMAGIDEGLKCGPPYKGNAYIDDTLTALPSSLTQAADLLKESRLAHKAFGEGVVEFYVHTARSEAQAYADAVTDWERIRYFERI